MPASARWRISASGRPSASSPSCTFSSTVSQGNNAKLWNTMAMPAAGPTTGWPRYVTLPWVGCASPEIRRNSVDFPEPDRPSRPTISPSLSVRLISLRTSKSSPSGLGKAWQQDWMCSSASLMTPVLSSEPEFSFAVPIERPPEQTIDDDHVQAHHRDPEHDAWKITGRGRLRDVGTQPAGLQVRIAPARHLGDDARVPGAARRGDGAGDVIGKHRRQRDLLPPQPAADLKIGADVAHLR